MRTFSLNPLASGWERTREGLRNDDALALMAVSNVALEYEQVNPCAYEPAIAPHIAAQQSGRPIMLARIKPGPMRRKIAASPVGGCSIRSGRRR